MARAIVAIMAIVVVGAIAPFALQAAAANAGTDHDITDESFTPNAGNVTTLDHSNLANTYYDETVTVYDSNGDRVDAQADYVWHDSNGTVRTVDGGALDGETSATIDYAYRTTTADQRALIRVVGILPQIMGALMGLLGVGLLLVFLRG